MTPIFSVDPESPEPEIIARAAAILRAGGLVAFPTETVYGLGANALDLAAVARIFAAKGRPANNPLIVHIADASAVSHLAADWPHAASQLAERFWPGPLTLVLPRCDSVPDNVTAGGPTVAVRQPAHPVARALIVATGLPLAAPSANRSTRLSPTRAEHVARDLAGRIDLILDGGPTSGGLESTVLDVTRTPARVLRPGPISPSEIAAIMGPVEIADSAEPLSQAPMPAPGMMARHYSPRTPLELTSDDGWERALAHAKAGKRVGWLTFACTTEQRHPRVTCIVMPSEPAGYAAQLYAVLHGLDEKGVDRIVVATPPDQESWLAVRDRLKRAATPESRSNRESHDQCS
jgi:L-threonylcarbamoyladenylate synthase